jgi:hypothetical protein
VVAVIRRARRVNSVAVPALYAVAAVCPRGCEGPTRWSGTVPRPSRVVTLASMQGVGPERDDRREWFVVSLSMTPHEFRGIHRYWILHFA